MATPFRSAVRVDHGHLYIGGDTYPLRNIARTSIQHYRTVPPPTPTWAKKMTAFGAFVLVGTVIMIVNAPTGGDPGVAGPILVGLLLGLGAIALGIWRIRRPKPDPVELTALEITTAGSPQTALWSGDRRAIEELRGQIALATNDLEVTYSANIMAYEIGDTNIVNVNASGSVGIVQDDGTGIKQS